MSALSIENLAWLVPTSVFVAGVVGSPHCVAMCGPLVMSFGREKKTFAAYQLGRMFVYSTAGALVGSLGHVFLGSSIEGISTLSLLALASLLVVFAIRALPSQEGRLHLKMPRWFGSLQTKLWSTLRKYAPSPTIASFFAGALTVFLPCLHLYAFLAGAAATGSATAGAIFMFTFWASTLPALSAAPLLMKRFLGAGSSNSAKRWAAGLFLTAALLSLAQFATRLGDPPEMSAPAASHHPAPATPSHHHH